MSRDPAAGPQPATLRGLPSRRSTDPGRAARTEAVDEVALALAHRIVELASDKKASDIVLLDVRAQTAMADVPVSLAPSMMPSAIAPSWRSDAPLQMTK